MLRIGVSILIVKFGIPPTHRPCPPQSQFKVSQNLKAQNQFYLVCSQLQISISTMAFGGQEMKAIAVCITGTSQYPDSVSIEGKGAYVFFTGQNAKMDDHLVRKAITQGLPMHIFWRKSGGAGFSYIGKANDTTLVHDGISTGMMEVVAFTDYEEVVSCGRHDSEHLAWKKGALDAIGVLERSGGNLQKCFVPIF